MIDAIIDTHVWIWYIAGSDRLAKRSRDFLNSSKRIGLCAVSIWEALILGTKGQVEMLPNPKQWILDALDIFPVEDIPSSRELFLQAYYLEFSHKDPADRCIAAAAYFYKVPLITSDRNLKNLKWLQIF